MKIIPILLLLLTNITIFDAECVGDAQYFVDFVQHMEDLQALSKKYSEKGFSWVSDETEHILLIHAAQKGWKKECKKLMTGGAYINTMSQAPLKEAIKHQKILCIKLFIQENAYLGTLIGVQMVELGYNTPLEVAAETGNVEILQLLLDAGVDINSGFPLISAIQKNRLDIARWLIKRGVDVMISPGDPVEQPIHTAAIEGNDEAIIMLVNAGNSVNAQDAFYETPLHRAARGGHVNTMNLLRELGAVDAPKNVWGHTAKEIYKIIHSSNQIVKN